jgi:hypothetical protein
MNQSLFDLLSHSHRLSEVPDRRQIPDRREHMRGGRRATDSAQLPVRSDARPARVVWAFRHAWRNELRMVPRW